MRKVNIGTARSICSAYFVAVVIIGGGIGRGVRAEQWLRSVECSLSLTTRIFAF